jgi:hypothetical protein
MGASLYARMALSALTLGCLLAAAAGRADATGTVRVQQHDGSVQVYNDVRIAIKNGSMALTSADGKGTILIGKAACTKSGELVRCLPYDATLVQNGVEARIVLQTGTVWLNPSGSTQQLSHSSQQLPSHGVLMAVRTKAGTYVSLNGIVDSIQK